MGMTQDEQRTIAKEFLDTMRLDPAAQQRPQFCVCMIGLPGTGKTTVVTQLLDHLPLARQQCDAIRVFLKQKGLPLDDAASIGGFVSVLLKDEGYNVAHDNDFTNPDIRAQLHERNRARGIAEVWVRVTAPEALVLDRLARRKVGYGDDHDAQVAKYYERKQFQADYADELDKIPYVYTFDTSRDDFDAQIVEAAARIKDALRHPALLIP